jgi:hypothetical protein
VAAAADVATENSHAIEAVCQGSEHQVQFDACRAFYRDKPEGGRQFYPFLACPVCPKQGTPAASENGDSEFTFPVCGVYIKCCSIHGMILGAI